MKILIFCLPGLGDTLMFTPVIRLLKESLREAQIEVVTMFKSSYEILENNPFIEKIYNFNFLNSNFIQILRYASFLNKKKFDISITAFPAYRREYHLLSFLVGTKKRIAHRFKKGYLTQLNFLNTDSVLVEEKVHNVVNSLNILRPLGINWQERSEQKDLKYDIYLEEKEKKFGQDFVKKIKKKTGAEKIIAFHIGSMKYKGNQLKRWPERNFVKVGRWLAKEYRAVIILLSGAYEHEESERVKKEIGEDRSVVILLPIRKVAAILENCYLFLGNDGGIAHLAAGLQIPTFVLFGITNPSQCRPWGKNVQVLESKCCQHCYYYYDKVFHCKAEKGRRCIDQIKTKDVMRRIQRLSTFY